MSSEVKLGALASLHNVRVNPNDFDEIVEHYSIPAWSSLEPELVQSGDIESSKIILPDEEHILVSCLNPSTHKVWRVGKNNSNRKRLASTEWAVVIPHNPEETDFINSALEGYHFQFQMNAYVTGTTNSHQRVKKPDFLHLTILFPEKNIRDKTGNMHSCFRTKSVTNKKIDENCSDYISYLFRSWFIDFDPVKAKSEGKLPFGMNEETAAMFPNSFEDSELGPIPSGWRVSSISEICKMSSGGTPSRSKDEYFSAPDTGYPWLASREINWSIVHKAQEHISEIGLKNSSAKLFPENTTVMAMYGGGTVGRCGFLGSPMTTSQAVCAMMAKDKLCLPIYLYSLIKSESERIVWKYAVGGAQVNLSQQSIGKHLIVLPPFEIIQKFESLVDELFANIGASSTQSEKLSILRDVLLPRLMSGELEV